MRRKALALAQSFCSGVNISKISARRYSKHPIFCNEDMRVGGPGFATIMRLYPDSNLGIVILSNGTDLDREGLIELLAGLDW